MPDEQTHEFTREDATDLGLAIRMYPHLLLACALLIKCAHMTGSVHELAQELKALADKRFASHEADLPDDLNARANRIAEVGEP